MDLTISQLLALIGPLDDNPGFDTARERFRRFLMERVTSQAIARDLVEQCLHTPGQQAHRALQDIVTLLGRFLKFETVFGPYEPDPGVFGPGGEWLSRHRLTAAIAVWTDQTPAIDPDAVVLGDTADREGRSGLFVHVALGIATPLFPASTRLSRLTNRHSDGRLRAMSLRSVLALAEMVEAERVSHAFIVELLAQNPVLDGVIELLDHTRSTNVVVESPVPVSDRMLS